jgi:hypothetical protein
MSRVVAQLSAFSHGMEGIQQALEKQTETTSPPVVIDVSPLAKSFEALEKALVAQAGNGHEHSPRMQSLMHEMEMLHSTLASLKDLAAQQRDHLRNTQQLLEERAKQGVVEIQLTQEMLTNERAFLEKFHEVLSETQKEAGEKPKGDGGAAGA